MPDLPWSDLPIERDRFKHPPREYGILPFWFLDGELDYGEMRFQLREFRDKGMPGIILHGRYGLAMPYLSPEYLDRVRFIVEEAEKLGLKTWIYDEMNWPSGTVDGQVLRERPDLSQRYIECIDTTVRGPFFTYLTGADSRYHDFERSTPVAAFALGSDGQVIDLTPNLSFRDVIPWEAPAGNWRLVYLVEKRADYYIDALNPEATAEFLRLGYEPFARLLRDKMPGQMPGFYTDEPAMHYYVTGGDNPIVPWTKDMFGRFQERNGYNLRPRLPDLFFDVRPDSARVRHDFYTTLTEFYSDAFYRQIHEWCQKHNVAFTGHLLYEEWLRKMIRVEGNLFKHYVHMDVVGVDHLYPIIGNQDRPAEHVALKVASSAAHQLGSERLLCESFGGIFMDATMQRMKWIADWEYVLGVNLLNPHGFHYSLEGPRKRDWPPSMFYQYPWWRYYQHFSDYISRLSHLLTGGRHVAKVGVLWPINAIFGTYTPQAHNELADRSENDFDTLTDLLMRLHYDFDYVDEDMLAGAELSGGAIRMRDEAYELLILPPMTHLKLETVERLEQFVAQGGRVLGMIFLPSEAFGPEGLVDISDRISALFGVDPVASQQGYRSLIGDIQLLEQAHPGGGQAAFLQSYALARRLPLRLQKALDAAGCPESPFFVNESDDRVTRHCFVHPEAGTQDITAEVQAERQVVADALQRALNGLIAPDVIIDNPEVHYLHRVKDGRDVYFLINSTYAGQSARVMLLGDVQPVLWDPSTGGERPIVPSSYAEGRTAFSLELPPTGSAFVLVRQLEGGRIVEANVTIDSLTANHAEGYGPAAEGAIVVERNGRQQRLVAQAERPLEALLLDGEWEFAPDDANALLTRNWQAAAEVPGEGCARYAGCQATAGDWQPMVPGAWSYQLPAEPSEPYPINVWYRIDFQASYLPPKLDLIIDGFAGSAWEVYVNGERATAEPVRSAFDAEMKALEITPLLRQGKNVIAVRLTLTGPTDGLLDPIKLVGAMSLERLADGTDVIAAPRRTVKPASWTEQGYPFFSGCAIYRRRFQLPAAFAGRRVFLEAPMLDDVLEVIINGQTAGVRLWPPYGVEITELLQPGENVVELRVANTPINLLEAVERPSGLAGAPRLVPCQRFSFDLPA